MCRAAVSNQTSSWQRQSPSPCNRSQGSRASVSGKWAAHLRRQLGEAGQVGGDSVADELFKSVG